MGMSIYSITPAQHKEHRQWLEKGHSSHVMNVRFSHAKGQKAKTEELKIYSVGGNDRAVFQWKLSKV